MKVGLSHPPVKVVWRIVSEDSKLQVVQLTFGTSVCTNDSLLAVMVFPADYPHLAVFYF